MTRKRKIAHIVNPVKTGPSSDLHLAQPVTFKSMLTAHEYAASETDVSLFTAQFPEDREIVPEGFTATPDLDRSVLDVASFNRQRKLPLIKDILDRLYQASDAEYFIYTNVDIALQPFFYTAVSKLIDAGFDGFTVNRRTISEKLTSPDELELMYAENGEKHIGHDCFIFRRDLYPKFSLADVCIGINWICRVLLLNIGCFSENFRVFTDKHMTFHIGCPTVWKNPEFADYRRFNKKQAIRALAAIEEKTGPINPKGPLGVHLKDMKPGAPKTTLFNTFAIKTLRKIDAKIHRFLDWL